MDVNELIEINLTIKYFVFYSFVWISVQSHVGFDHIFIWALAVIRCKGG